MTRSPTTRRSQLLSSPERNIAASFLLDTRNNELSHRDALAAAQVEHERVRQAAIRVYELHELQQEHRRIVEEERKEQERLRAEALVVAEEKRLRELKAKTIPRLPPEPEPPTPPPAPKPDPSKTTNGTTPVKETKRVEPSTTPPSDIKKPALAPPTTSSPFAPQNKPTISSPLAAVGTTSGQTTTHGLFQKTNGTATAQPAALASTQPVAKPAAPPALLAASPTEDRYSQIHQELKKLRRELQAQSKVPGSPLKGKLGTFRREIRVAIGQLTGGKGANAKPVQKITDTLKEALRGNTPSPPIDVSLFVVDKREPVQGATHNDQTLPSLFIYLMNICAKAIINQFINEGGANPKAADPVGVFTAHIFSNQEFEWRGQSLIDIVMAKYRIVCPVLFGHRGSDRTERGRISIGWKKDGPAWITEQSHNDRMTGLGAGFASLSLRDFSKSSKKNPYPPTNYWKALAYIVNSPPNEISNTQYVVLRSMIQGHEQRFLNFYGNAALAALRLALVEFPNKAPQNATAAGSLAALADVLKSESGLVLA